MKITMNIDDGLLERVMRASGVTSKTKAVDLALRELDRRSELKRLALEGLGLEADALKDAVDPAYNLAEMRRRETPVHYGCKTTSR